MLYMSRDYIWWYTTLKKSKFMNTALFRFEIIIIYNKINLLKEMKNK